MEGPARDTQNLLQVSSKNHSTYESFKKII